jgi:hypothetical protein
MKKKIIIILSFLIIVFIISNYKVFLWNYYFFDANKNYYNNNFTWALYWYNKSLNFLSWSNLNFNLWNTYYKIWENHSDTGLKITNFKKSINYYSWILNNTLKSNIVENPDVRYNYEFVKKKLEELENQEEQESKQDSEENNSDNDSDWNKTNNDQQENNKESTYWTWNEENTKQEQIQLSPEELKQIEQYIDRLKDEEKYNRQFYNNIEPVSNNPIFDSLFDRSQEKDW